MVETDIDATQCCNLATSQPIFTNSSTRVTYEMFFRSLAKILKKGVAPPPEIKIFYLPTDFHRNLEAGCLRDVPHGAGEKLRKRGRAAEKWKFLVFDYPQTSKIFVFQTMSSKFYPKGVVGRPHLTVVEVLGKGVRQGSNRGNSGKSHVF